VRISAVFVGVLNALFYSMAGDSALGEPLTFSRDLEPWPLTALYALAAVAAGLLASEVVLRFVGGGLRSDFYARHLTLVLAVCVGGMLLGTLLTAASVLTDSAVPATDRTVRALFLAPFAGFVGALLGLAEGMLVAIPLAGLLGLFRESG
jgi:hypothetical protein